MPFARSSLWLLGAACCTLAAGVFSGRSEAREDRLEKTFKADIQPLVKQYCAKCHDGLDPIGGISLTKYSSSEALVKDPKTWERVIANVKSGHMPPEGAAQPSKIDRDRLIGAVETVLSAGCETDDPGRVTVRRLNRQEYNNTIRDLLGIDFKPADDFPSDDVGYGFDNIGDVLTVSPLLMEKYLDAAEAIAQKAIILPGKPLRRIEASAIPQLGNGRLNNNGELVLFTNTTVPIEHDFAQGGQFRIGVRAYGQQAGPELAKMAISLNGKVVQTLDVAATSANPTLYEVPINAPAGKGAVAVSFTNDYYRADDPDPKQLDRNLVIEFVEITGPLGVPPKFPESHTRVITETPTEGNRLEVTRRLLGSFAKKAFRRPVKPEEVEKLVTIAKLAEKEAAPFERGMQLGLQAILVSPHFLFRIETDPSGGKTRDLNPYELATRLSYFLWSSTPDQELLSLADSKELNKPQVYEAQVRRLLKDSRSRAIAENFGGQWLQLR
ncbi:MAG TPA: DUF1587 domain-containing protein, partial [Fimbriimonadaceae bacterium]|nr:DUF1587 domain-containing protein [Fimbriimonadaceae bacterium]